MLDFRFLPKNIKPKNDFSGRRRFLLIAMMSVMGLLTCRAVFLQIFNTEFYQHKGETFQINNVEIPAYRGTIKDRNGVTLAGSMPVSTIVADAKVLGEDDERRLDELKKDYRKDHKELKKLADADLELIKQAYYKEKAIKLRQLTSMLNLPKHKLTDLMAEQPPKRFVYLAKKIDPAISQQIKELKLAGIECLTEFKRFYPVADVSAHLVGFTDIEGVGQVGLELGYEKELKGTPGGKRVLKDGHGQVIAEVASTKPPESGKSIELTIDQRIQYLAYKELEAAVTANKAQAGTLVILDAKSGDIIAAVNQPSFNPNTRENLKEAVYRNRAFTEVFEPGSTVKPFIVAASLDHGLVRPNDVFYTQGVFHIGSHTVKDVHNYGTMDLTQVLKKSSNIAVSQMALKMSSLYLWEFYRKLGFSLPIKTGFPGEARGSLINYKRMREFDRATLSFGYGVNVSALQLAQAYTALADDGMLHRANLIKNDDTQGIETERRVFTAATAKRVRAMMEHVVSKDGTAYEARVHGYTVAGKTGTVKKANGKHGYAEKKYFSVFAGMAPAKNPRLVMVVMIDEPSAGQYYGGLVSAPVFSKVMSGALRILDVAPDQLETMPILLTQTH